MSKQLISATGEVLIIHTWGIGDLILLTPVLRAVHTLYPQLKLSFLFFPHSAAIPVRGAEYVHSIQFTAWKPAILLKTIIGLRQKRYAAVLFTSGVTPWKAWLFMMLLKAKVKVGEYKSRAIPGLSVYAQFNPLWSRTRANYNLFQAFLPLPTWEQAMLSKDELHLSTQFILHEGNIAWANSYLETHELSALPFVCLHPGSMAKNKYRRWKQEYFVSLISMLKQNYPYRIIVIAGPDELDVGEYISAKTGALLLTEKSLSNVAALISRCCFFINTDSGLGHIASCFGVLSLTIFGPGDEKQTAPFSPNSHIIRYETDCAPCVGKKKQQCEVECLTKLKPDIVFARVTELLASLEQGTNT